MPGLVVGTSQMQRANVDDHSEGRAEVVPKFKIGRAGELRNDRLCTRASLEVPLLCPPTSRCRSAAAREAAWSESERLFAVVASS
jgi:hypothetical protein